MLKELNKQQWLSMLGISEDMIPHILILHGTRSLREAYAAALQRFKPVTEINCACGLIQDLFLGKIGETHIAYAPVYGAPMASEAVHVFGVLGTPLVIHTGSCGALSPEIEIGDIVVPEEAFCGEGASQYYLPGAESVECSPHPAAFKAFVSKEDRKVHFGLHYTTSALFAEGKEEVLQWTQCGFTSVDMETSAVFAAAEYFNMDRLSIMFVYDNPGTMDNITCNHKDIIEKRTSGRKKMYETLKETVEEYEKYLGQKG